jgi:hypothetical protein
MQEGNNKKNLGLSNLNSHMSKDLKKSRSQSSDIKPHTFTQQKVDLSKTPLLFFPEGFEKIFIAIYFVTLPYIAGLLFLFFYVSGGNLETFASLNKEQAFILTWAIGYEIIASFILLWIFKMAISFVNESRKPSLQQRFRIP